MKIAHVTSELCRESAGLGAAVEAISSATQSAGNDVRVFGLSSQKWRETDSKLWTGAPATTFEVSKWTGPFHYGSGMLAAINDYSPDVVHLHGLWTYPSIAAHSWQRSNNGPLVVSAHGMLQPASLKYKHIRKTIARVLFQDRVLRRADVLHASSTDEEKAYQALSGRSRTEIVPLAIDSIPRPGHIPESLQRRVLFLGRLHHQKGLDWLLEAWLTLHDDFPNWELAIVGPTDPGYLKSLEVMKKKAANHRVNFMGPLYAEEKYQYIAGSDLFVMPSRSENFGLVAAESLLMEVPVIATKGTPWPGLISSDAGWWIEPGAASLEKAMRKAMKLTKAELRRKGENGRNWILRDFSWRVVSDRWQTIYQSLVT